MTIVNLVQPRTRFKHPNDRSKAVLFVVSTLKSIISKNENQEVTALEQNGEWQNILPLVVHTR